MQCKSMTCTEGTISETENCVSNAECILMILNDTDAWGYVCQCKDGYTGDGIDQCNLIQYCQYDDYGVNVTIEVSISQNFRIIFPIYNI